MINIFLFTVGLTLAQAWFFEGAIDCTTYHSHHSHSNIGHKTEQYITAYCNHHKDQTGYLHHTSTQTTQAPTTHRPVHVTHAVQHHQDKCNDEHQVNHINLLWKDWLKHGDVSEVQKLYADLSVNLKAANAGSLPSKNDDDERKRASFHCTDSSHRTIHDLAYINHDTVPSYSHVRHLTIYCNLEIACKIEIKHALEEAFFQLAISTTHKPATQHHTVTTHTDKTQRPTTPSTTTATTHKLQTTVPTTVSTMLSVPYTCDLLSFVRALAHDSLLSDPAAGMCSDGSHTQPEAMVKSLCNVVEINKWKKGIQVMGNCQNIPSYTPLATFVFDAFATSGNQMAGVLVECTADGFKAAFQLCGHSPRIYELHINATNPTQNPNNYYVIA